MTTIQTKSPYLYLMEAVIELHEEEQLYYCPYCHQWENLSFLYGRLNSSSDKWVQFPDGSVVHNCELSPLNNPPEKKGIE